MSEPKVVTEPNAFDYSEASARKAALSKTIQHPLTLWPATVGTATGVITAIFSILSVPVAASIAAAGIGIGVCNWAVNFFGKNDSNLQMYYAELHHRFELFKNQKLTRLISDLKRLSCTQGVGQVQEFDTKIATLREILGRVMSPTELTYSRFLGTAEKVFETGIQNLERVVNLLTSIRDINRERLESNILVLKKNKSRTNSEETLLNAYERRARDFDSSSGEVMSLLAENEEAITAIGEAATAAIRIGDREASMTAQEKMRETTELLDRMIARAKTQPKLVSLLVEEVKT